MSNQDNYYIAMSDEAFNEIKEESIKIWRSYDDTYLYATGKINQVKDLSNTSDNAMYIIGMFDPVNTRKLLGKLSKKTLKELNDERLPINYLMDFLIHQVRRP